MQEWRTEEERIVAKVQRSTAHIMSFPNRPWAAMAAPIRGWVGGIWSWQPTAEKGWEKARSDWNKLLAKAPVMQLFTPLDAHGWIKSSLPTMLINWLGCQSTHSKKPFCQGTTLLVRCTFCERFNLLLPSGWHMRVKNLQDLNKLDFDIVLWNLLLNLFFQQL
jgi:hypothetical protein